MHDERSHPLLQQTPLSVNPFIDLPKPPTLPPNYTSLPSNVSSALPPSALNAAPAPSNPDQPAYVISSGGGFAAHPSIIQAQNEALLEQLEKQERQGKQKVEEWESHIRERELQEKRRKAPGWLDSEMHLLEPEKAVGKKEQPANLMDEPEVDVRPSNGSAKDRDVEDLGDAIDRAFGRSEMG